MDCSLGVRTINGRGPQRGHQGIGLSRGVSSPSRGPSSSEAEEMLTEVVVSDAATEEEIPCSEVAIVGASTEDQLGLGSTPPGIPSFAPSPSLNVFTNIFQVSRMGLMRGN